MFTDVEDNVTPSQICNYIHRKSVKKIVRHKSFTKTKKNTLK